MGLATAIAIFPLMKITLLLFATLKSTIGKNRVSIELDQGATVKDLKAAVAAQYPATEPYLETVLVSVDREYAFDYTVLEDGAEVGMFPPVSGGSGAKPTVFKITEDEIDLNELTAAITLPSTGAACIFSGMVRGETNRDGYAPETDFLEYEAYVPMAEAKMQQVADEIREKWAVVEGIAIVQRIGKLYPGTPTVLIACTAGHRDTGVFDAARYGIDRLKEIVPVWKKEVGPGGQAWVEGAYHPTEADVTGNA